MMAQRDYRNDVINNIFGNYIRNMRQVPGREERENGGTKDREQLLFEMVDDYIEQA